MNPIQALKKAHQSKAVTQDTHTLQNFIVSNQDKQGIARMELVGIESKYIAQFDKNSPLAKPDAMGNGYRTRFFLKNGETVGTFSQAGYQFFVFYAELMGYDGSQSFLHIDIDGVVQVDAQKIALDGNKSTYSFDIIEEGSELNGFTEYLPTATEVLGLPSVDPSTGEIK